MGVFNNLVVQELCPKCRVVSQLTFQVHTASSPRAFERLDRLCLHNYSLGQTLPWFPQNHKYFEEWKQAGNPNCITDDFKLESLEKCYGECATCGARLNALVTIVNFRIMSIKDITRD